MTAIRTMHEQPVPTIEVEESAYTLFIDEDAIRIDDESGYLAVLIRVDRTQAIHATVFGERGQRRTLSRDRDGAVESTP